MIYAFNSVSQNAPAVAAVLSAFVLGYLVGRFTQ